LVRDTQQDGETRGQFRRVWVRRTADKEFFQLGGKLVVHASAPGEADLEGRKAQSTMWRAKLGHKGYKRISYGGGTITTKI